jgi:hypothetical protein
MLTEAVVVNSALSSWITFSRLLSEAITIVDTFLKSVQRKLSLIETIVIKTFLRPILNGSIVGLWRKIGRHIDSWTKRERNL